MASAGVARELLGEDFFVAVAVFAAVDVFGRVTDFLDENYK